MRDQRPDEERTLYLLKVAREFVMKHASEMSMVWDDAVCDGYCLAEDISAALRDLEDT